MHRVQSIKDIEGLRLGCISRFQVWEVPVQCL